MSGNPILQLPILQNWSCHNCSGCCREHLIEITDEEKRRIEGQNWQADPELSGRTLIQPLGGQSHRLAHQENGACVFLDERGLCRIHARFGEPAKPLACRVYPYAFHPNGKHRLSVSLRFSCPSVVRNLGHAVLDQQRDLVQLAKAATAGHRLDFDPPPVHTRSAHGIQNVSWQDFSQIIAALDEAIADEDVHLVVRLVRILSWLELLEECQFQTIQGEKLNGLLRTLIRASVKAQPDNDLPIQQPSRMAKTMFRQTAAQLSRHDDESLVRRGLQGRLGLLSAAVKFATGWGTVPELSESASVAVVFNQHDGQITQKSVRFSDVEAAFDGRQAEIDELMTRYFRVKIQGIHFCGPAHYHSSVVDGFRSLALMYPVTLWRARIRAAQGQRSELTLPDVQAALATVDHNFGYSPALGTKSALNRTVILSQMKQLTRLIGWYSL